MDMSDVNMEMAMKRSLLAKSKLAYIMKNPDGMVFYTCVECSAKYDDKEKLERHLTVHNREFRFLCGICGTGLKRKEHLDRHTLEHQEVRPHACPDCGKAFKRKEHLNIHRSIHSGDKSEQCPLCNKTFYRKDHLRKHIQTHTKVFMDQYCDGASSQGFEDIKEEVFDEDVKPNIDDDNYEEIMEGHEEKYSMTESFNELTTSNRPFMCVVCHKSYKKKDHLKTHSWTHKTKDKICSECGKGFHTEDQLTVHMNVHLQSYSMYSGDDYIKGDSIECEEFMEDNNSLLVVQQSRQNEESRPHECTICRRRFKRKQHLKVHLNVHNKHPCSLWCSVCEEGFVNYELYDRHHCGGIRKDVGKQYDEDQVQSIPQEAKKENKYPEEFVDVSELAAMNNVQYAEVEERALPTPQRVFVCRYCSKPFKRKDHYKIHLHIHTGIRSFFCVECGKGFYRKDHLQKHMQVHNKVKPKKEVPDLYPISMVSAVIKKPVMPEITIHAPSSAKLRVPLQIKVPYQMVTSMDNGEQHAVTIDPLEAGASS